MRKLITLTLLAVAAFTMSFANAPTSIAKETKTVVKKFSTRHLTGCGYTSNQAATQAATQIPLSPFEFVGNTLITFYRMSGESTWYYCYDVWIYSVF